MKFPHLVLIVVLALLVTDVLSESKPRKHKKYKKRPAMAVSLDDFKTDESNESGSIAESQETPGGNAPPMAANVQDMDERVPLIDPCLDVHCGAGMVCELDKQGEPQCVCIDSCPEENDSRRKVCSNRNETWPSDCSVYQERCWCRSGDTRCKKEDNKHLHIEYYGTCRDMKQCTEGEMGDFPRRMRDWLFNVMRDLADRQELSPHYMQMQHEAESNMTRRWTNAAIWKFCDLDGHPPDRYVSRHELFPIRAPLMALEHCIAPFLNSCDVNDDHRITIKEWAKCLELEEDDIENRCEEIAENNGDLS